MDTTEEQINIGRFYWKVKYRKLASDEGTTIRLFGPVQGETKELARFDCFNNDPHYHIAFYDHNTVSQLDRANPLETVLKKILVDFDALVQQCGADSLTEQEHCNHAQAARNLRGRALHIERVFGSVGN